MTKPSRKVELTILKVNNYLKKGEQQQYNLSVAHPFWLHVIAATSELKYECHSKPSQKNTVLVQHSHAGLHCWNKVLKNKEAVGCSQQKEYFSPHNYILFHHFKYFCQFTD